MDFRCRVHGLAFEISLFTPIIAILVVNLLVSCCILHTFYLYHKDLKSTLSGSGHRQSPSTACKLALLRSMALATIPGLTWITGLFMFDNATLPVQYLFTAAVSLQGISTFWLHCVANPETRKHWCEVFKLSKVRNPRLRSNTLQSDVYLAKIPSSSSDDVLVMPGREKNSSFFLQIFSSKPSLKSPASPKNVPPSEVFENATIPEVTNPLHRRSKDPEDVNKVACTSEQGQ